MGVSLFIWLSCKGLFIISLSPLSLTRVFFKISIFCLCPFWLRGLRLKREGKKRAQRIELHSTDICFVLFGSWGWFLILFLNDHPKPSLSYANEGLLHLRHWQTKSPHLADRCLDPWGTFSFFFSKKIANITIRREKSRINRHPPPFPLNSYQFPRCGCNQMVALLILHSSLFF